MDLNFGPEHEAFRAELRSFLKDNWHREDAADPEKVVAFRRKAIDHGFLYRWVPRRYGGSEQAADPVRVRIVAEEFGAMRAPGEITSSGVRMLVPTLLERGREDQRERFVRKTLLGQYVWCQGYSEPGSGSDLASLKTRAVLDSGEWVINGQKVWTSHAHRAHYMFALVRTEPDAPTKHAGLSYLLLDMKSPGITVRPLKQMTGGADFNEVFLDNVRTPADWIVGGRGEGWAVSRTTLKHERDMIGSSDSTTQLFERLVDLARNTVRDGAPLIAREDVRQALARIEGAVLAQKYASYHQLSLSAVGREDARLRSVNKLAGTEIGHDIARLAQMLIGDAGLLMAPSSRQEGRPEARWVNQIMGSLGVSIAGGTSNIQRNIIAERGLGLPRDEAVSR
jgi:alkylation response protein AidB-like acyl-CoA dehydrogenase